MSPKLSRSTESITFSLPPEMAQHLRQVVKSEDRTVSDLLVGCHRFPGCRSLPTRQTAAMPTRT